MLKLLSSLAGVALLTTLSFAQSKGLPARRAGVQPAINSICEDEQHSANLLHDFNCGFESGDFSYWAMNGDPTFTGVADYSANSGSYGAYFGAIGDFTGASPLPVGADNYHVEFWLTNPLGGSGTEALVQWYPDTSDTTNVQTLLDLIDSDPFDWTLLTFGPLPVTGDTGQLVFYFRHDPDYWYLDDVDIEPSSSAVSSSASASLRRHPSAGGKRSVRRLEPKRQLPGLFAMLRPDQALRPSQRLHR
jgi:hypothetical protein